FEGPARTGAAVRAQHNLTGHPLIGFIGSFQSWHDVVGLVEAFDIVQHQKPEARLLLVGDGPDRPAILAKVKALKLEDKIIFAGKVDHERVPEYLAAFDVAAAPFRQVWNYQYGSPLKLFEYMGAGKPTVAAGIGQVKEVVDHERTGLLYPPQDIQALSTLLLKTLNDPVWAATLGAAARTQVLTRHTWRRVAEQIIGIAGRK
ncbi:MAG: glycosyltransferase, partial [bacterium]